MEVKLADNYGFCFGVKRAIEIAEASPQSATLGPLIHNPAEINRLNNHFGIRTYTHHDQVQEGDKVIIRTHGIPKEDFHSLQEKQAWIADATCPFVKKPQEICEKMALEGYETIIFGDSAHPEVQGVRSYAGEKTHVVLTPEELSGLRLSQKVAVVSQTTRKVEEFMQIVNALLLQCNEVRVFNTICNATLDNQEAALKLAKEVDIFIVIGGKNSSNTKQLLSICQNHCSASYLIERGDDLDESWFEGKKQCGVTAGASTPDWIIQEVVKKIREI